MKDCSPTTHTHTHTHTHIYIYIYNIYIYIYMLEEILGNLDINSKLGFLISGVVDSP